MRPPKQMETSMVKYTLYTWGANSFGQLGLKNAEDHVKPQCAEFGQEARTLRAITGGGGHSALITESGKLLVCGQNHRGQLGLGHVSEVMTFQLCQLPGSRTVQQVSCGWDFTIILTDDGHVLACGSNAFGQLGVSLQTQYSAQPLLITSFRDPVISVSAGLRHALAVTGSGCVYQWGTGLLSQAKRALNPQPVPAHFSSKEPCMVTGMGQIPAKCVTAGSAHCACLTAVIFTTIIHRSVTTKTLTQEQTSLITDSTHLATHSTQMNPSSARHHSTPFIGLVESCLRGQNCLAIQVPGEVFLWGSNKHGQLCRKETFLPHPTALDRSLLNRESVSAIHSGWTHLIAQTESGRVLTWGRASYGQLGRQVRVSDSTEPCLPSEVRTLHGATQIACGSEHNLAIVGNRVFSWGWNEHGMCGDGSLCDVIEPQPIPDLQNVKGLLIGCGAGHSLALCSLKDSDNTGS